MEKEQRCQTEVANLDLKMALAKSNHKIGSLLHKYDDRYLVVNTQVKWRSCFVNLTE